MYDFLQEYTQQEFADVYNNIYEDLTCDNPTKGCQCAYILGGQPGSGKSSFYKANKEIKNYIAINGDEYRKYHPHHKEIEKYDMDNYAQRTQGFVNQTVQTLIKDLSEEGYNLIIEGTLRDPNIPIETCKLLNNKNYTTKLTVVACDAEIAWESTLIRAEQLRVAGINPRLVPIDKYDAIVQNISHNLAMSFR